MNDFAELAAIAQTRAVIDGRTARLIRVRGGVSQAAMARAIGVTRPALSRYETGARIPREQIAIRYAAALQSILNALTTADATRDVNNDQGVNR